MESKIEHLPQQSDYIQTQAGHALLASWGTRVDGAVGGTEDPAMIHGGGCDESGIAGSPPTGMASQKG